MYDIKTGAEMEVIHVAELNAFKLAFNVALAIPTNRKLVLAAASWNGLQLWRSGNNSATLEEAWTHHVPELPWPLSVAISVEASLACFCFATSIAYEKTITLLDLESGHVVGKYVRAHFDNMTFSGVDLMYQTLDPPKAMALESLDIKTGRSHHVYDFQLHDGCQLAVTRAQDKVAFAARTTSHVQIHRLSLRGQTVDYESRRFVNSVTLSRDCKLVIVQYRGYFQAHHTRGDLYFESPPDFFEESDDRGCIAISPDSQYVVFQCSGDTVVWNIDTGQYSRIPGIPPASKMVISNDDTLVATYHCSSNHEIAVWSIERKEKLLTSPLSDDDLIATMQFSPDDVSLLCEWDTFDWCSLDIASAAWSIPKSTTSDRLESRMQLKCLWDTGNWVRIDEEDILWLPARLHIRAESFTCRGLFAAIAQDDGRVTAMEFIELPKPKKKKKNTKPPTTGS